MYQWFVFTHLADLVLFVLAHGASAFASFQIARCATRMSLPDT